MHAWRANRKRLNGTIPGMTLNDLQALIDRANWLLRQIGIKPVQPILQKKLSRDPRAYARGYTLPPLRGSLNQPDQVCLCVDRFVLYFQTQPNLSHRSAAPPPGINGALTTPRHVPIFDQLPINIFS